MTIDPTTAATIASLRARLTKIKSVGATILSNASYAEGELDEIEAALDVDLWAVFDSTTEGTIEVTEPTMVSGHHSVDGIHISGDGSLVFDPTETTTIQSTGNVVDEGASGMGDGTATP